MKILGCFAILSILLLGKVSSAASCGELLTKVSGASVSLPALNPAALKFIQLASEQKFIRQTDPKFLSAGYFSEGESRICTSVSFEYIYMALNAIRQSSSDLGDIVTSVGQVIAEGSKIAKTDVRKGMSIQATADPDFLGRRGLRSKPIPVDTLKSAPELEKALETELAAPTGGLMIASTVTELPRGGLDGHVIVVLGLDAAKKVIIYSNPMEPNNILYKNYSIGGKFERIYLGVPLEGQSIEQFPYIDEANLISSSEP